MAKVWLFVGPRGTGKWSAAEQLRKDRSILNTDVLRVKSLTADAARSIVDFSYTSPVGKERMTIVRIPHTSTRAIQTLLKVLEDAPDSISFVLLSSAMPIDTIVSRSQVRKFSLLTDEEVTARLLEKRKMGKVTAAKIAKQSGGQVSTAFDLISKSDTVSDVIKMVKALSLKDAERVESMARVWTDDHTDLLGRWCRERLTERWSLFPVSEVPKSMAMRVLISIKTDARPRLVVRSILTELVRK